MLVYIHADNSGSSRIFRLGYPPFPLASPLLFLLPLPLPFTAITVRIFEARNLYSGEGFCHEKLVKLHVSNIIMFCESKSFGNDFEENFEWN